MAANLVNTAIESIGSKAVIDDNNYNTACYTDVIDSFCVL